MGDVIPFPNKLDEAERAALAKLNEDRMEEENPIPMLEQCVQVHFIALTNDLHKLGFRFDREKNTEFLYNVIYGVLMACIYRNQGFTHALEPVLEEIMRMATQETEK